MTNSIAKVVIPYEKLHEAINSPELLNAQSIAARLSSGGEATSIYTQQQYDETAAALKLVNDAIKYVGETRKQITEPLDAFKKQLIKTERDALQTLSDFVETAKAKMLDYHADQQRIKAEAEAKLRAEAEASLRQAQSVSDIMATFTDSLYATSIETGGTKNVRTTIKARISGEVDWAKVLGVLFSAGELEPERLLERLPKAMEFMHVDNIDGIELYEHKTQVIR